MDSGRRSNMSDMTNEDGFYPEDPIEEFEKPQQSVPTAPVQKKGGKSHSSTTKSSLRTNLSPGFP